VQGWAELNHFTFDMVCIQRWVLAATGQLREASAWKAVPAQSNSQLAGAAPVLRHPWGEIAFFGLPKLDRDKRSTKNLRLSF
jgi:hypothetical protein